MCYDTDARPPHPPVQGGAADGQPMTLTAADGNTFRAFSAMPEQDERIAGVIVMPDVRGLHPFYEVLATQFAERGIAAVAMDYFGRTAGVDARDESFEFMPHVQQTTPE